METENMKPKNFKSIPTKYQTPEILKLIQDEIDNMCWEMEQSASGQRSYSDEFEANTSTKSTYPAYLQDIFYGKGTKSKFLTAAKSVRRGAVWERIALVAIDRLENGYSNEHGYDEPCKEFIDLTTTTTNKEESKMAKTTYLYIDFEFNSTQNKLLNLVCCSIFNPKTNVTKSFWLHNDEKAQKQLSKALSIFANEYITFVAYAATAEARAFISLNLNPILYRWIDLYLEYRMLLNHNHDCAYGKQLIKGKITRTFPPLPKWEQTEEDKFNNSKPETNLAAACYKLLGIKIDTKHKTDMRDLIISNPEQFTPKEQSDIIKYCDSDVIHLPNLQNKIIAEIKRLIPSSEYPKLESEMLLRGEFAARTAIIETNGYPINYEATLNFSNAVPKIYNDCCKEITELFPEIKPFVFNKKTGTYTRKEKNIRENFIEKLPDHIKNNWLLTEKGKKSLALDAFTRHFNFSHHYPPDNFGAQMVRISKLKQSLNGFSVTKNLTGKGRKNFWEFVGDDQRVRFYQGIYGSQSGRSQPPATGFIPLKPAWQRSLIQAPEGMALCSVDYSSQEFLISALISKDSAMIGAYASGDPYFHLAKLVNAVPKDAERKDYELERSIFKTVTLGLSYGLTKYGLAIKLSQELKKVVDEEEAQELIDQFYEAFPDFLEYKKDFLYDYKSDGYAKLPCGWVMFGDNDNDRSINNFPIQGTASSILRQAIKLCQQNGLNIVYTLHDSIVIQCDAFDFDSMYRLRDLMVEAFHYYLPVANPAFKIRCDIDSWSNSYAGKNLQITDITTKELYIDKRSLADYNKFSKYFKNDATTLER